MSLERNEDDRLYLKAGAFEMQVERDGTGRVRIDGQIVRVKSFTVRWDAAGKVPTVSLEFFARGKVLGVLNDNPILVSFAHPVPASVVEAMDP